MKEIKSLRKRNERHFLNSDGSITCYLYNHDIHYKKNNEYVPINNKLINNKNYIQNEENDFKVSFLKDKRKKEILDINKDNHYLKISLDKRIAKNPEIKDNKISYKEALDNIDIDYEVISKTLKESIIIKDKNSIPKNLSFRVDTDLRLRINNGIEAKDENKNIIFMIEKPFMKDSKENYNYNINYTLIKGKEDYLLKLNLDQDWLESKDRKYPVYIDPTITSKDCSLVDTYISSKNPNTNYGNETSLKVGRVASDDEYYPEVQAGYINHEGVVHIIIQLLLLIKLLLIGMKQRLPGIICTTSLIKK